MSVEKQVNVRSGGSCELCGSSDGMTLYTVAPRTGNQPEDVVHVCSTCNEQLNDESKVDANHWRCLNDAMWSEVDAVKVVSYRMLHQLKGEGWPSDLLEMMYLDDETLAWAKEGLAVDSENAVVHKDSNGVVLNTGDTVTIIKDLNVKGSSLVAKRGTSVRNIRLVHDNAEQIEGKVEGQNIVILTQYVKK